MSCAGFDRDLLSVLPNMLRRGRCSNANIRTVEMFSYVVAEVDNGESVFSTQLLSRVLIEDGVTSIFEWSSDPGCGTEDRQG